MATTKLIPIYTLGQSLTTAEENALAATLTGVPANRVILWNSTLNKTRYWDGAAFQTITDIDDFLNPSKTATITYVSSTVPNASYRTILDCSGSHTAAKVAGTYAIGHGSALAVSGTGTLYPLNTIYIASADYPTLNTIAPKLRIRAQLYTNDVAPTGNFTLGLYPITRPSTSGGAGLCIFTMGTVVSGSNGATFTTPAADGLLNAVGSDFSLPSDGHYVIGVVTTATVATSAHIHISAQLQLRNN
jgi:hypothetical protein